MRIQLLGLGKVGKSFVKLLIEREEAMRVLGNEVSVVSVSDSGGTAVDIKGLNLIDILKHKEQKWKNFLPYVKGYSSLEAIRNIESDVVVEATTSTTTGEPGLGHIESALGRGRNVVTANKGPLAKAYGKLLKLAHDNGVRLLYEATVAGHLPVFCLVGSCFIADELLSIEGVLNATSNFILGEMEKGNDFQKALDCAIKAGWTETDYNDDVDGIDAARKVVIIANSLFKADVGIEGVKIQGIRHVQDLVRRAQESNMRTKLICEIVKEEGRLRMAVAPKLIPHEDPLATVNKGDMGIKFRFRRSEQIFVSAQFSSPMQTAYAMLNDMLKISLNSSQ
jgi:homoserine dehydrogenase